MFWQVPGDICRQRVAAAAAATAAAPHVSCAGGLDPVLMGQFQPQNEPNVNRVPSYLLPGISNTR